MTSQLVFVLALAMGQTPSLDSVSPRERSEAVRRMAVLGNRDAVPGLVDSYRREPRRDIRVEIVAALGSIRDLSAAPLLTEALTTDFEREVRLQAMDSLLGLYIPISGDGGFFSFIGGITRVFSEEESPRISPNVTVDASVKEALVQMIRTDFDEELRRVAAHALGSLNAADQIPALVGELEGPRHREYRDVRVAMVRTLGLFQDQAAGPALTRLLRDADEDVAREAIRSVGLIGYRDAYPQLVNLFRSRSDDGERERVLQSIALMRHPEAVAFFESLLDSREAKERELAAEGLARLDYDASGFAARIGEEGNDGVRLAQAFALVRSGQSGHVDLLAQALDTRRWSQAEVYLYELGRFHGQIGLIYPYLRHPEADVRERLLQVLGRIGDPESRPYIQPLTDDRNADVAAAAVGALRRMVGR